MKVLDFAKKNKLLLAVALAYVVLALMAPTRAAGALSNSVYYLKEMIQVLPAIFFLTVVIEALVPKETIIRSFGEKSGFKGYLLALLLGSISAGPIYAAFPISKTLLNKGASVANVVIILSSWAVVKLPMLANEVKFLGPDFMLVRWVLTVLAIFAMAALTGLLVKKKDLPIEKTSGQSLVIAPEYCIGCSICVKMAPDYYEMQDNKAIVRRLPETAEEAAALEATVAKCPGKAITLYPEVIRK